MKSVVDFRRGIYATRPPERQSGLPLVVQLSLAAMALSASLLWMAFSLCASTTKAPLSDGPQTTVAVQDATTTSPCTRSRRADASSLSSAPSELALQHRQEKLLMRHQVKRDFR